VPAESLEQSLDIGSGGACGDREARAGAQTKLDSEPDLEAVDAPVATP
jgi:hypothetical protein